MLKIQYAPRIDDTTITAFEKTILKNGSVRYSVTVPFKNSVAIEKSDFDYLCLKLKSAQSNKIYAEGIKSADSVENNIARFDFVLEGSESLFIGQYYKIQIAYGKTVIENGQKEYWVGAYSPTEIVKLAERGTALIKGMNINELNLRQTYFKGSYDPSIRDPYEKEEKYEFILYDNKRKMVDGTGILIHDTETEYDEWYYPKDLKYNQSYFVEYIIYTINGLRISSGFYEIEEPILPDIGYDISIYPIINREEACIEVYLKDINLEDGVDTIQGYYSLSRTVMGENEWTVLQNFVFDAKIIEEKDTVPLYKDYYIEQGVTYIYGLQRYNIHSIYSDRIETDYVTADFEHMYLIDPDGSQLKIKYNPNISSFKNTILETKIDTIGGNFPFIFRNKKVKYKEMNISGLLSYLSDEDKLFYRKTFFDIHEKFYPIGRYGDPLYTPNGTQTFYDEREFKLKVLEWLNNGEVKVLKTPTEGNYLIRLMNVSLTPEKTTGRLLHSFQATAYEIEEYNPFNLLKLNFIKLKNIQALAQYVYTVKSVNLFEITDFEQQKSDEEKFFSENLLGKYAGTVDFLHITGAEPGTEFEIDMRESDGPQIFQIGMTGHYEIKLQAGRVRSVRMLTKKNNSGGPTQKPGILTFNYWAIHKTDFDQIKNIQHKGYQASTIYGGEYAITSDRKIKRINKSILSSFNDIKNDFGYWTFITFRRRPIKILEEKPVTHKIINDWTTNKINDLLGIIPRENTIQETCSDYYLYYYNNTFYEKCYFIQNNELCATYYTLDINSNPLYQIVFKDISGAGQIDQVFNLDQFKKEYKIDLNYFYSREIILPPGVVMDMGCRVVEKTYDVEDTYDLQSKRNYIKYAEFDFEETSTSFTQDYERTKCRLLAKYYYNQMLKDVEDALERDKHGGLEGE